MCVMQYAHCHNYSKWCLTRLLRKEHAQKTELIVTRYPPDIVLNKGSDKYIYIFISYRPETRGIPQKITLRDEIFRGRSPRNISSRRVIFCGIPRVKGL